MTVQELPITAGHGVTLEEPPHAPRQDEILTRPSEIRDFQKRGFQPYNLHRHAWERLLDRLTEMLIVAAVLAVLLLITYHTSR